MADPELAARRREEILTAAFKVFSEKGYHAANVADIAASLGIGHGTFYRYFESKYDVFSSVVDQIIQTISMVVVKENPQESNSLEEYREQLIKIGDGLFEALTQNPYTAKILFFDALGVDEHINRKIQNAFEMFGIYTELYLKNGISKGFVRPDLQTKETSLAINAMILEAARHVVASPDLEAAKAVWVQTVINLMLDGIGLHS